MLMAELKIYYIILFSKIIIIIIIKLTILVHVNLETFSKSTCSTLISVSFIYRAPALTHSLSFTCVLSTLVYTSLKESRTACKIMKITQNTDKMWRLS